MRELDLGTEVEMGRMSGDGEGEKSDHTEQGTGVEEQVASSSGNCDQEPSQEVALFSPGFSSAAAKAGWDAEALLMAALSRSPVDSGRLDASQVAPLDVRKRDKHTPLSASAPRHRRVRLEDKNGSPLGRLPMKPLTLLLDNDPGIVAPANESCSSSIAEGKENLNQNVLPCKADKDVKGKQKEPTPTKPLCLDQLREELSCAVCLDICFEPSTISCGHSFCGTCLQSVLQKCGPRCPKCRQPLRGEAMRTFRVNTVLWNTIQILFPKESAARIEDKKQEKKSLLVADEAAAAAARRGPFAERQSGRYLGTRPNQLQPWTTSPFTSLTQTNVLATLRTSFQAASELMMPSGRERGSHNEGRPQQSDLPPSWPLAAQPGRRHGRTTRQTQAQASQEQVDAALAARLQQAELNAAASSDGEDLLGIENPRRRSQALNRLRTLQSRADATASLSAAASASAAEAVSLRSSGAQRASRQRSRVRTLLH